MKNLALQGKRVVMRVDFNVPINASGEITNTARIDAALPTLQYVLGQGGQLVLMSHLGRPKQAVKAVKYGADKDKSLQQIVSTLEDKLGRPVAFVEDCGDASLQAACLASNPSVVLLENLRFYPEEKKNDLAFAEQLASWGDVYVNDAFGTAHRAHASTAGIAQFFSPDHRVFGLLMQAEIDNANNALSQGDAPKVAILGGAKVSDKLMIIENLCRKVDAILIGGGMSYTFKAAQGGQIGNSLCEEDRFDDARRLLELAAAEGCTIHLPADSVCADAFSNDANTQVCASDDIPEGWMGLDIGPQAAAHYTEVIAQAKTIIWNGPMGVFEMPSFQAGSKAVAEALANVSNQGAYTLVGGGDSVAAVHQFGLASSMSFISTGGGALLELLEGKTLPGIHAITE